MASTPSFGFGGYGATEPRNSRWPLIGARALSPDTKQVEDPGLLHLPLNGQAGQTTRTRIDFVQIFVCAIVPLVFFAVTCGILSFRLHFISWPLVWLIALLCLLVPLTGIDWLWGRPSCEDAQGKWMVFLRVALVLTWLAALIIGSMNYDRNMKPFYDMSGLNYSPSVNPSTSGQAHIDAGRMMFLQGSRLETNLAMGVKIGKTYCVAPVTNPDVPYDQREYDFWAVGIDCCSSVQPQDHWTCPDISNRIAHAGMRLMSESSRPFFRMAVQEAEATYKLNAKHPIFLHWMEDPSLEMATWRENGIRLFWASVFSVFIIMIFTSLTAGLFLARCNMQSQPCAGTGFAKYAKADRDFINEVLADEGYEGDVKNIIL